MYLHFRSKDKDFFRKLLCIEHEPDDTYYLIEREPHDDSLYSTIRGTLIPESSRVIHTFYLDLDRDGMNNLILSDYDKYRWITTRCAHIVSTLHSLDNDSLLSSLPHVDDLVMLPDEPSTRSGGETPYLGKLTGQLQGEYRGKCGGGRSGITQDHFIDFLGAHFNELYGVRLFDVPSTAGFTHVHASAYNPVYHPDVTRMIQERLEPQPIVVDVDLDIKTRVPLYRETLERHYGKP